MTSFSGLINSLEGSQNSGEHFNHWIIHPSQRIIKIINKYSDKEIYKVEPDKSQT